MSPEQQIFTRIRMICVALFGKENVYDYLPSDADYPFVFIGEQFKQNNRTNKDRIDRQTQVTTHIYHNSPYERGTVTKMMHEIEKAVIKEYGIDGEDINTQLIPDNSTNVPLMHGILELNIEY